MKNVINIDVDNSCECTLVSCTNADCNRILLAIRANTSMNPVLHIFDTDIPVNTQDFQYEISSDKIAADTNITFTLSNDHHTSDTFTIKIPSDISGNWMIRKSDNFTYYLITKCVSTPDQVDWDDLMGKPSTFTPSNHTHLIHEVNQQKDISTYETLLDYCLDNPFAMSRYKGYGLSDCILGNAWGSVITLSPQADAGVLVFAFRNNDSSVYMRKTHYYNSKLEWNGDWLNITGMQEQIDDLDELSMIRRGALTSTSVLSETKRGIHYCNSDYPSWLPCGWCYLYMPTNGTLNGSFVVCFASGTSAGHYTYSNRYNKWVNHDDVEALNQKIKHQLPAATIWADSNKYIQFRLKGGQNRCMIGAFDSHSIASYYPINWQNHTGGLKSLTEIQNGTGSQGGFAIYESDGTKRIKFMPNTSIGRTMTLVVYDVFSEIIETWVSDS